MNTEPTEFSYCVYCLFLFTIKISNIFSGLLSLTWSANCNQKKAEVSSVLSSYREQEIAGKFYLGMLKCNIQDL